MNKFRVLVADNDSDALEILTEFLEDAGYDVVMAKDPLEAEQIMAHERLHLAILDLRLREDSDQNDRSGLRLAKLVARALPKIIFTRFPVHEDVREALKPDSYHLPPAVDFVDKRHGYQSLAESIEEVLNNHAPFNWELGISLEGHLTISQLTQMLINESEYAYLAHRIAELEDLLRKLFFTKSHITIGEPFLTDWQRIVVPVYTYTTDGYQAQYIVSLGKHEPIKQEYERFETAVPQAIRTSKISLVDQQETTRFMAAAYTFMGGNLEHTILLDQLFERQPASVLGIVTTDLFQSNLALWYQGPKQYKPQEIFLHFLKQRTLLEESASNLLEKIQKICIQANELGNIYLELLDQQLTITDEYRTEYFFNHPLALLDDQPVVGIEMTTWGHIHGCICKNTVLVDDNLKTWVINFSKAGFGPLLFDFVSFETAVKYHLLQNESLSTRLVIDGYMLKNDNFEAATPPTVVSKALDKAVEMTKVVREMAVHHADCDWKSYQLGLYYCALGVVTQFDENQRYRKGKLMPYIHALCSASILAAQFVEQSFSALPSEAVSGLWIDQENKFLWVEGKRIDLTLQEFEIMRYLYQHQGELCERRAIVEDALKDTYDPHDVDQSRLNSAMSRLRQKIENDPKNPRYLQTIRGRGYELRIL